VAAFAFAAYGSVMRASTIALVLALVGCSDGKPREFPFAQTVARCHDAEVGCPRPIFAVRELKGALAYYRDRLGFTIDWEYGEPADFASVTRGDATIFWCLQCQGTPSAGWLWVFARDVDKLHREIVSKGAKVRMPPTNMPWGAREMHVEDDARRGRRRQRAALRWSDKRQIAVLALIARARRARWVNVAVVNLRFLIAFAFVPAAMKKLLGQPFTDPKNQGPFHDFLHGFYATGWFYSFVGAMQLTAAVLLFTQRFATLGAALALPILTAIMAFCWSTHVVPTATVATLMWLGTLGLLLWDIQKWRGIFARDDRAHDLRIEPAAAPIDMKLWSWCGIAILIVYVGSALAHGGVYRPRGIELGEPAFYALPAVLLLPIVTFVIDQRRVRNRRAV
jgi:uncharacterized glyoxalase superfamily protein PhnB